MLLLHALDNFSHVVAKCASIGNEFIKLMNWVSVYKWTFIPHEQ